MNRLSTLMLAALATPHLPVSLTLFSENHGVYEDSRHLWEWIGYLEHATAEAYEDYDTYGGGFPPGIDDGFLAVSNIERMLTRAITHTCEVPVYTCEAPTYSTDVPF